MNKITNRDSYVYMHFISEHTSPFYVGIGKVKDFKRAFSTKGRNNIWRGIFNKNNCVSKVVYTNLTWKEACEIEMSLIYHYGRINKGTGVLSNLTDGGDGNCGVIFSDERRANISKSLTGRKLSDSHKEKCRKRRHSEYTKNKISRQKTGLKASDATKEKMKTTNMVGVLSCAKALRKPVVNIKTGEVYISVKQASESIGVTKSHLSGMLLGRYNNWSNLRYK